MKKYISLFLIIFPILLLLSCSQNDDDPDNVKISGRVYHSPQNKIGIRNVVILVNGTKDEYTLSKQATTDKNGKWSIYAFLGSTYDEQTGKYVYNYQLPVKIGYYYPDINTLIGEEIEITLTAGKDVEMPDFYIY